MAIFPIRRFPDPVLRMAARPVEVVDPEVGRLIDDMIETMYAAPGVGLAAPQIGIGLRVVVFDAGKGPHGLVNPVLEETSGSWVYEEGCLSVPNRYWPIKRPALVRASGLDRDGRPVVFEGDELLGRVLQHEIDHVDGTLLLSRLPRRTRREALRELREESIEAQGPR
ncbi:MAG: peptide deformylase [Actinomycetota bacterium]